MPADRLIRIDGEVFEVVTPDATPGASLFLLNRSGRIRRRIEILEHQLATARAELAQVEANASHVEVASVSTSGSKR